MTIRSLLEVLAGYTADGRTLDEPILVRLDGETRKLSTAYVHGTLVLVAGMPIA